MIIEQNIKELKKSYNSEIETDNRTDMDCKRNTLHYFCDMHDDCSGCILDKIKNNCDFYNMPDEKINQLYEILEKRSKEAYDRCLLNR